MTATRPLVHALAIMLLAGGLCTHSAKASPPPASPHAELLPAPGPFTYEGNLVRAGVPFTGTVNTMFFRLYTSPTGEEQVGPTLMIEELQITDGHFAIDLDFGDEMLAEEPRWLEVTVDDDPLLPRTRLVAFPVFIATEHTHRRDAAPTPANTLSTDTPTAGAHQPSRSIADILRIAQDPGDESARSGSGTPASSPPPDGSAGDGIDSIEWRINGPHLYYNFGHVGIGTANPAQRLHVWSNSGTAAVHATHAVSSGSSDGIRGITRSTGGRGIFGLATSASGGTTGVLGQATSTSGRGVAGLATSPTGPTFGILGQSSSTSGRGVFALAAASSGTNFGIVARTNSPDGYAGFFLGGRNYFAGNVGIGRPNPAAPLDVGGAIAVHGQPVINASREWVGEPIPGAEGPPGPQGPPGPPGGTVQPLTGTYFAYIDLPGFELSQGTLTLHNDGTAGASGNEQFFTSDARGNRAVDGNGQLIVSLLWFEFDWDGEHLGSVRARITGNWDPAAAFHDFSLTARVYLPQDDLLDPATIPWDIVHGSGTAERIPLD